MNSASRALTLHGKKLTYFVVERTDFNDATAQTYKRIGALFKVAEEKSPAIIFFDEIDRVAGGSRAGEFKNSWPEGGDVVVIGATNRIGDIDEAIKSRFGGSMYVPLPNAEARRGIVKRELRENKVEWQDGELDEIVRGTDGLDGRKIKEICGKVARRAAMDTAAQCEKDGVSSENMSAREITMDDFRSELRKVAFGTPPKATAAPTQSQSTPPTRPPPTRAPPSQKPAGQQFISPEQVLALSS